MCAFHIVVSNNGATISATVLKGTFQKWFQQIDIHNYTAVAAKKRYHLKPNAHLRHSERCLPHLLPIPKRSFSSSHHRPPHQQYCNTFLNREDNEGSSKGVSSKANPPTAIFYSGMSTEGHWCFLSTTSDSLLQTTRDEIK